MGSQSRSAAPSTAALTTTTCGAARRPISAATPMAATTAPPKRAVTRIAARRNPAQGSTNQMLAMRAATAEEMKMPASTGVLCPLRGYLRTNRVEHVANFDFRWRPVLRIHAGGGHDLHDCWGQSVFSEALELLL